MAVQQQMSSVKSLIVLKSSVAEWVALQIMTNKVHNTRLIQSIGCQK